MALMQGAMACRCSSRVRLVVKEAPRAARLLERPEFWSKSVHTHAAVLRRSFATSAAKRKLEKRGVIKKRGMGSVKAFETEAKTESEKPKKGIAHPASLILGVFPILATATLVAFRPDLQEELKERWGMVKGEPKQSPTQQQQ